MVMLKENRKQGNIFKKKKKKKRTEIRFFALAICQWKVQHDFKDQMKDYVFQKILSLLYKRFISFHNSYFSYYLYKEFTFLMIKSFTLSVIVIYPMMPQQSPPRHYR